MSEPKKEKKAKKEKKKGDDAPIAPPADVPTPAPPSGPGESATPSLRLCAVCCVRRADDARRLVDVVDMRTTRCVGDVRALA
jgi:hypothetical protein